MNTVYPNLSYLTNPECFSELEPQLTIKPTLDDLILLMNTTLNQSQILNILRHIKNNLSISNDTIKQLLTRTIPLANFNSDEFKLNLLRPFNLNHIFETVFELTKLLNLFTDDAAKILVLKKKIKETESIYQNVFECIDTFKTQEYKRAAIQLFIEKDKLIDDKKFYYAPLFPSSNHQKIPIVGTIINKYSIPLILHYFSKETRFTILGQLINSMVQLTKGSMHDIFIHFEFCELDKNNIINIIEVLESKENAIKFLRAYGNDKSEIMNMYLKFAGYKP